MFSLEYPPRVRVEWFLAAARVGLATGALVAVSFDPPRSWAVPNVLLWYLVYSLGVLAFVWAPVRFGRGADIVLHLFDLATFSAVMLVTNGAASPFFVWAVFLLVSATIRWQVPGTFWTAVAAAVAFGLATFSWPVASGTPLAAVGPFIIRVVYLLIVAALLAYLGAHHRRFFDEISRLATWPRTMSREPYAVVSEILSRASDLLNAPRILLVWGDAEDAVVNLAWLDNGSVNWKREQPDAFGPLVLGTLTGRTFQTPDAASDRARVVILRPGRYVRRRGRPINERLRARFDMREVQSWPLEGDLVHGRMFCLGKTQQSLDDLSMGEFVAQLATSRLDGLYLLDRLRDASALEERVRVARDLHDSLLQSQAGAALQLLAARRMLDRDPAAARQRLEEVQQHLEHGELEMRAFIRNLRPSRVPQPAAAAVGLRDRLEEQARRIERQWDVKVVLSIDPAADQISDKVMADLFKLVQEGIVNAARHADASAVRVGLSLLDGRIQLTIADDGKGFPFAGTYDLASLERMHQGPVTLRERVAELDGDLTLKTSKDTGTELLITVPLGTA